MIKYNLLKYLLGAFLLVSPVEKVLSQNIENKQVLVINPGHGGSELGYDKKPIKESYLNLNVSKLIQEKLNSKYNLFLTREADSCVNWRKKDYNRSGRINLTDELLSRIEFAKGKNPDYVINLHFNASRDTSKEGVQIFYPAIYNEEGINNNKIDFCAKNSDCDSYSKESYKFAEDLGKFFEMNGFPVEICGADYRILIGTKNKDIKKIKYPLERIVILELGYMTNKKEYEYMVSEGGQERYASLVAEYFNSLNPEKLERKEIKINYGKQISQLTYLR